MRSAAEAFEFARDEEVTVTAAVVQLIKADVAAYRLDGDEPPLGYDAVWAAARRTLAELDPGGRRPHGGAHALEARQHLRPRLGDIRDTAKGLAMLVELCACQPWVGLKKAKRLRREPRQLLLHEFAVMLGGDTSPEDVDEIDALLYKREFNKWWLLVIPGGIGIGLLTAGLAAPAIGGAIGGAMGLSGAAATNAGLAALGGGSLASGGLGIAGGTALIGGMGVMAGGGTSAAAGKLLLDKNFSAEALKMEARKLSAFVARMKVHGQSSQAKAQAVINELHAQVKKLNAEIERLRRTGDAQDGELKELKEKVKVLSAAIKRMEAG